MQQSYKMWMAQTTPKNVINATLRQ